jgi:hypothetical protein
MERWNGVVALGIGLFVGWILLGGALPLVIWHAILWVVTHLGW